MQIPVTLAQLVEKLHPHLQEEKILRLDLFHAISSIFGLASRKAPTPCLPFHERPGSHCTWRIPMVPILQTHTQIPPI